MKSGIVDPMSALVYLADCHAATCEMLASRKSVSHTDFKRHCDIAVLSMDVVKQFDATGAYGGVLSRIKERYDAALTLRRQVVPSFVSK